jgi:hypothetical protein
MQKTEMKEQEKDARIVIMLESGRTMKTIRLEPKECDRMQKNVRENTLKSKKGKQMRKLGVGNQKSKFD